MRQSADVAWDDQRGCLLELISTMRILGIIVRRQASRVQSTAHTSPIKGARDLSAWLAYNEDSVMVAERSKSEVHIRNALGPYLAPRNSGGPYSADRV